MVAGKSSRYSGVCGWSLPKVVALAGVLSCCIPQSCAQDTQAHNKAASIHGTVLNSVTREPIGRALVVSSDNRFAIMTDDQGHFEFTFPQTGTDRSAESNSEGCENIIAGDTHGFILPVAL